MPLENPIQTGSPKKSFGERISAFFAKIYSILFSIFEFILRSIIAILTSIVKVIRAIGIAVGIIFVALALLAFVLFHVMDLPNSQKFQNFREESFGVLSDWIELEFAEIKERAAILRGDSGDLGAGAAMEIPSEDNFDFAVEGDLDEPKELPENPDGEFGE